MTLLRRIPCQGKVGAGSGLGPGTSSPGFVAFRSCGSQRPLVRRGYDLASNDRVQPSDAFCTLRDPLSHVSGQKDLISYLPAHPHIWPWQPNGSHLGPF